METKPPIPPFTIETARQKVRLVFDDVAGNNIFNTLGNIVSDPRVSLLFRKRTLPPHPSHRGIQMTLLRLTSLVALTFFALFAQAQSTAPKELSALLASQAAAEALTSCDKLGHKVSVTVLDRNGLTRAVLKHERATPHTLDSSRGKAYTIVTLGPIFKKDMQSELVAQLAANPAAAALTSVPGILLLPGAVLIKSGDEVIGSIGVGGAPSGLVDEGCAKAGLEKIASSLK